MPGLSGRQLADELTKRRPATRVLYTSGYTDDAVVRHGVLEAGIAYLQKPFTSASLARKVRETLDARPKS
jgi:FixJ family two-component response regulator